MSALPDYVQWPFFDATHREMLVATRDWAAAYLSDSKHPCTRSDVDERCRVLVKELGRAGLTRYCVREADGGALREFDARAICLVRETLAWWDGLADFAFAMQGLGSGALSLAADADLRSRYLPRVAAGQAIAAFALSEPEAGSDVAAMATTATPDGSAYVLNGSKTWISNGGIADFYCVLPERHGEKGGRMARSVPTESPHSSSSQMILGFT